MELLRHCLGVLGLFMADVVQKETIFFVEKHRRDLVKSISDLDHLLHGFGFHRRVFGLLEFYFL